MSPVLKRPVKKPARRPIKVVRKKPVSRAPAKKSVRNVVTKKAPGIKRGFAKTGPRKSAAKPIASQYNPQAKQMVQQFSLAGKTNQDIINVIYKAADELKMPAWTLLTKVKLEHLVDARSAPYTGPVVSAMPGLTPEEKAVIQKVLVTYRRPSK